MSERLVPVNSEQAQILEDIGVELMRLDDDRAMKVLALSLAYKWATPTTPPVPSNVISLVDRIDSYSRRIAT